MYCLPNAASVPKRLLLLAVLGLGAYMLALLPSVSKTAGNFRKAAPPGRANHRMVSPPVDRGFREGKPNNPIPFGDISSAALKSPILESFAELPETKGVPTIHSMSHNGPEEPPKLSAVRADESSAAHSSSVAARLKHILYWNEFYGSMVFMWGAGQEPFIKAGCAVNTCFGTNNRSLLPMADYDAILFHVQTLPFFDWPRRRAPHQRYVFVTRESAQYLAIPLAFYGGLFNVTLTYRRDSDFPYPYGAMVPIVPEPAGVRRNYAVGKTKLVAWFVSHCLTRSEREVYVDKLKEHIPVDVYGSCGSLKCPRSANQTCHKTLLNRDYKFYLSFENSICNDYVTEKLFNALEHDVVPIVLGGANYSTFAPPGSYIDALQYSPKELAEYLLKLDKNDTLYNEYFLWKGKYRRLSEESFQKSSFCDLCEYLHTNEHKVYNRISQWWTKGQCRKLNVRR